MVSKEIRNYEECGWHENVVELYQHNFDRGEHVLIKEGCLKRLASGNFTSFGESVSKVYRSGKSGRSDRSGRLKVS